MSEVLAPIITSVVTGGSNSHATVVTEANAYATDFVSQGCLGTLSNSNGSGPCTGSFGVQQDTSPDMGITIKGAGNTTNSESIAYINCTPASQDLQVLRARMSSDTTSYTINANSSGITQYDWIYLQANPTNAATPDSAADNVVAIYTSRSSSNTSDNGSPPTYGIHLATVTVVNGASSITNSNIADARTQVIFNTGGVSTTTGWQSLGAALTYSANNGSKEFQCTATGDLTGTLSPGMRLQVTRSVSPPNQCMAFAQASSQYASKSSPSGVTFTSTFTCEAWVYCTGLTGSVQQIITRGDNATAGFYFGLTAVGQVYIEYGASSAFTTIASYQSIPLNEWVHVAGAVTSLTGKAAAVYINGLAVTGYQTASGATTLAQTGNLFVGATSGPTNYFNGYLSEVRVWSQIQSAATIQANMGISISGATSGLVCYFPGNGNFNDGTSNDNNLTGANGAIATQANNPYNIIEYFTILAASFSSSTTLTLYGGTNNMLPNMTLNNAEYSTSDNPYNFPVNLKYYRKTALCLVSTPSAATSTTPAYINGLSIPITVPANTARVKVTISGYLVTITTTTSDVFIFRDTTLGGVTNKIAGQQIVGGGGQGWTLTTEDVPPVGATTFYSLAAQTNNGSDGIVLTAGVGLPITLMVECDI